MTNLEFAIALAKSETEEDVIALLQTRGYWEVANDYMGGPFVSHSFYSPDGIYVVVCDAFVYAPKYDKRQYLRQVESLLYSWEWKEEKAQN